jgi:hypothetical protein
MRAKATALVCLGALLAPGCTCAPAAPIDAGLDAAPGIDALDRDSEPGTDAEADAPIDAHELPLDVGTDAPTDGGPADAPLDAGIDGPAPPDAGTPDASRDAGMDAPPSPPDAGPPDAPRDAGPLDARRDAGPPDAPRDAGPADGGPPDASDDGGPPDAPVDAGPRDAGPDDAGPPDAPTGPTRGSLIALHQGTAAAATSWALIGLFGPPGFGDLYRGAAVPGCIVGAEVGACRRMTCAPAPPLDDAGTLTVAVAGTTVVTASRMGDFYLASGSGALFAPGDVVRIAATGAVVPAFAVGSIAVAPPSIVLPSSISRSADLVLTWSAPGAAIVAIGITSPSGPGAGGELGCFVPASAGTVTIAASLLAPFAPGETVQIGASAYSDSSSIAGSHVIDVFVGNGIASSATVL